MTGEYALIVVDAQPSFIDSPDPYLDKLISFIEDWPNEYVAFTVFQSSSDSQFNSELGFSQDDSENRIHPRLRSLAKEFRIFKKDTYDALKNEDFKKYILDNNFKSVYLAGLETDACILSLSYSLFDLGVIPKVILPLCKTKSDSLQNSAVEVLERNIGDQNLIKQIPINSKFLRD